MGASGTKTKVEKPKITIKDLSPLLNVMQLKTQQSKTKKVHDTLKKKGEIVDLLKNNNMEMAMAKMDSILRNDDFIAAYDILIPLIEILKEKCTYIVSNDECPAEIRPQLDTVLYAARRIEIEEYMKFKDKIQLKYGEAYIIKADNNSDKLVNENLVEKLGVKIYKEEVKKMRLRYLAKEKNINIKNSELVPGGDWEVDIQGMNYNKNPYESIISNNQTTLPTKSFVEKYSGNQNQGDGFPRDEGFPMQQNYPSFNQGNQGPKNPFGSYSQGNQEQNNQFPPSYSQNNQGQNNQFPNYSQNNQGQNNQFPNYSQNNQGQNNQFPNYSQNNQGQNNQFPNYSQNNQAQNNSSMSNQNNNNIPPSSINNENNNNNNTNNNSIPPSNTGSSQVPEEKKEDSIFGKTVTETVPVQKTEVPPGWGNPDDIFGPETLKTQITNIVLDKKEEGEEKEKDPFGGATSQTIHASNIDPFGAATSKTMHQSIANPDNKENPFDNDPFAEPTLQENQTIKSNNNESLKKSEVDPFAPGAKIDDPFGGETL
jgi:hypothetical protein